MEAPNTPEEVDLLTGLFVDMAKMQHDFHPLIRLCWIAANASGGYKVLRGEDAETVEVFMLDGEWCVAVGDKKCVASRLYDASRGMLDAYVDKGERRFSNPGAH